MYTKLDRPNFKNDVSSNNTSSSARIFNYLADEDKLDGLFFNQFGTEITKTDAIDMIDNNVKGLRENEIKFYSITLNPSEKELQHISNSKEALIEYTRGAMDNFAKNINKSEISAQDLVWSACIHDKRYYTNLDKYNFEKKNPNQKFPFNTSEEVAIWKKQNTGECPLEKNSIKLGENSHIHIVVSRRNFMMDKSITLHGRDSKEKFNLISWQENNQVFFQNKFNYRKNENLLNNFHTKYIEKRLSSLGHKGYFIDKEKVYKGFNKCNDLEKKEFLKNLDKLNYHVKKGNLISDPIYFLKNGKIKEEIKLDLEMNRNLERDIEGFIYKNTMHNNNYDSVVNYGKSRNKRKNKKNIKL